MKNILSLVCFAIIIATTNNYAQSDFSEKIKKNLESYTHNHPEKIYVQTDKPFYSVGEDLWFSAYLVNGITHQKSDKSNVLHIELINEQDSIIAKKKLYLESFSVAGDFKINKNWKSGTYLLRAYTKYMQNEGLDYFFQKEIPIYDIEKIENSSLKENSSNNTKPSKPTLKFYPEGGNLIAGIANKIAFEIKDNKHQKINGLGVIKDQDGHEILDFKTMDLGLGNFIFIPEKNKSYYASIYINGKEEKYTLPKTLDEGYTIGVVNNGQHIIIQNSSTTKNGLKGSYLVAHQRGHLLYKKFISENKTNDLVKISTEELADGVINITLFNHSGNPVAERLVFIDNPKNDLQLNIKTPTLPITPRKKITVKIDVKNNNNQMVPSTLSMAVRDLKAYPHNTRSGHIKSWLLLNSDLKGSIKNAGYFFEKGNDLKRRFLLDLVMMTHGWRRFTWTDILNNKKQTIPPEKGLYISGTTKYLKKPYSSFSAPTRLTFLGKDVFQEPITSSDSLGKFKFGPFVFFDSIPVLVESRIDNFKSTKRKNRNVVILIDKDKQLKSVNRNVIFNKQEHKKAQITNFIKVKKYIQEENFKYDKEVEKLKEITLVAKLKSDFEKRQDEMSDATDYGEPINGQRLDLLNDFTAPGNYSAYNIVSQMNGVHTNGDSIFVRRSHQPATILLDNLEIDASLLYSISGDEISFIDILDGIDLSTFSSSYSGVIALYSNSGNVGSKHVKRKPGIIDYQAKGFYTAREFYTADYENNFELINKQDLRTTLYWNPTIQTTSDKETQISFYTSDIRSDYIIEIEGISTNGQPIHAIKTFNVE